jgi:RNA polymerase sigma-70 factor (ECF subfamily)
MQARAPSGAPRPSGEALARRLADDLEDSFEDLVLAHQDALYAFVVGLCRDAGRAEEVVQDAFLRAYRALRRYEPERIRSLALKPWLYRIALNVFRNSLRGRRPRLVLVERPPESAREVAGGPEDELERRWERERLLHALAQLPEDHRSAVMLRYLRDFSYTEAAEVLGQPVGTVKSNVHRGVERLRGIMQTRGESA